MDKQKTQIRVRYVETDQMGVVYHSNYAIYFEIGRTNWLRDKGITYREMEENGIMLPVVQLTLNYKKPALYDDLLTLETTVSLLEGVKIAFEYEIYNEKNELLTTGSSLLVFVDKKTGKPMAPPTDLIARLKA